MSGFPYEMGRLKKFWLAYNAGLSVWAAKVAAVADSRKIMRSDPGDRQSISAKARARRCQVFVEFARRAGLKDAKVLDIGGTLPYWEMNAHYIPKGMISRIEVVNLPPQTETSRTINGIEVVSYAGNALELSTLRSPHYDLVFSNSVIEHVGNLRAQLCMAEIVRKMGDFYFVQTPAKSFPLEPHFYFPYFPYLPLSWRTWIHQRWTVGFMNPTPDWLAARIACEETRLMTMAEVKAIFPQGHIIKERLFGLCKSYMVTNMPAA
jgi:hypothetical protein